MALHFQSQTVQVANLPHGTVPYDIIQLKSERAHSTVLAANGATPCNTWPIMYLFLRLFSSGRCFLLCPHIHHNSCSTKLRAIVLRNSFGGLLGSGESDTACTNSATLHDCSELGSWEVRLQLSEGNAFARKSSNPNLLLCREAAQTAPSFTFALALVISHHLHHRPWRDLAICTITKTKAFTHAFVPRVVDFFLDNEWNSSACWNFPVHIVNDPFSLFCAFHGHDRSSIWLVRLFWEKRQRLDCTIGRKHFLHLVFTQAFREACDMESRIVGHGFKAFGYGRRCKL
mmetsp:Transcript_56047/g.88833  ORF Transcript_56047/g.88833 Transcript_56047/m.88833 type:complete len:287 (-) Transcript_56047:23-883(-)